MNKLLELRTKAAKWMLWTEEQLDWAVIGLIVFICYISYTILGG